MKNFINKMMKRTKSFTIADYGVLKACLFIFGLWMATIIPVLTTVNPRIYGGLRGILYIYLIWKMFKKD